ncbi:MAG TPA: MauE/DoxX family redox-associated membrane protein [Solirubrobacterales bacterium]|nr:MauE/DoxX family redox-associated membrane protein [Solirubrobacterales bacterium]
MLEIVLRVGLGIVLAGAALAKLAKPRESIGAMSSFGFEAGPIRPLAWAGLIALELGLAVGVVLGSDGAAYGAAALMLLFAALTAGAIFRGRAGAPCACFGPGAKVSWLGVLRNLGLAAGFALAGAADAIELGTEGWLGVGVGAALLACGGLIVAVLGLAREVGMLRLQLGTQGALEIAGEGPEIGSSAAELADRIGRNRADLGLAVFTSEGCHLCQTLAPAIDNVAQDPRVLVARFDEVMEAELWRSLGIPGSPFALALDREGTVLAKGTFNNLAQLESVLATAERRGQTAGA